ncbi:MAG: hypothetical protein ACYDD4_13635 [Acidimicrobiales bacterium]
MRLQSDHQWSSQLDDTAAWFLALFVPMPATIGDVRRGFVYERVPHATLKSIAQNPDIREGMSREEIDAAIARHADRDRHRRRETRCSLRPHLIVGLSRP